MAAAGGWHSLKRMAGRQLWDMKGDFPASLHWLHHQDQPTPYSIAVVSSSSYNLFIRTWIKLTFISLTIHGVHYWTRLDHAITFNNPKGDHAIFLLQLGLSLITLLVNKPNYPSEGWPKSQLADSHGTNIALLASYAPNDQIMICDCYNYKVWSSLAASIREGEDATDARAVEFRFTSL